MDVNEMQNVITVYHFPYCDGVLFYVNGESSSEVTLEMDMNCRRTWEFLREHKNSIMWKWVDVEGEVCKDLILEFLDVIPYDRVDIPWIEQLLENPELTTYLQIRGII